MLGFASYYGDHMVLQKEPAGAVVWGYGEPGAAVTVALSEDGGSVVAKKTAPVKGQSRTLARTASPASPGSSANRRARRRLVSEQRSRRCREICGIRPENPRRAPAEYLYASKISRSHLGVTPNPKLLL